MNDPVLIIVCFGIACGILLSLIIKRNRKNALQVKLSTAIPETWRNMLATQVLFYKNLSTPDRLLFEKRVQLFLATKKVEGIDTDIDDTIKLMVASSAIIPTFAFPEYNYPHVHVVLIYPNSFDEKFQTQRFEGHKELIMGMVGNRFMDGTVILSKPDLVKAFDGQPHKENVGIHEFVHLLDKEDGIIDGVPELLLAHRFVGPWLHEIKKEMTKIELGTSDINPYALTNNAEFLAVVSEYFFENPEKFERRHPELYAFLSGIFNHNKNAQLPETNNTEIKQ
jgi:Mlc titration factor MtfA (ptsG expression regulator)